MVAKSVEELLVYQKALLAADEIFATLKVLSSRHDYRLRDQLGSSSSGVAALIAEGFGQSTDRFLPSTFTGQEARVKRRGHTCALPEGGVMSQRMSN
jgi:hypothetical protein